MMTPEQDRLARDLLDSEFTSDFAGAIMDRPKLQDPPQNNTPVWVAMAVAIATVLVAQAHTIPEPWGHVLSVVGSVLSAVAGVYVQRQ